MLRFPYCLTLAVASLCATLILPACGSSDGDGDAGGLDPDEVTAIPEGDATGTDVSGVYSISLRTTACSGACSATVLGFAASVCDVGELQMETITITQEDGLLEADWTDPVSLLRGGIDQDGSYDIGGYATQSGGEFEITMRAMGTLEGGEISGEAESWSVGLVEEDAVDCYGTYEIEGVRIGGGGNGGGNGGDGDGDGESCDSDADCAGTGLLCNDALDICMAPGSDGTPCAFEDDCINGCNDKTDLCALPGEDGTPCAFEDDCINGCNDKTDVCEPPADPGSPCAFDDDCASGVCLDTDVCG